MNKNLIEFSGMPWSNSDDPREIISKTMSFIQRKYEDKDLVDKQCFIFPKLAKAIQQHHYYLRKNRIQPDHFKIIVKDAEKKRFELLMHISSLKSANKYRKVELQKNFTIKYRQSMLLAKLEDLIEENRVKSLRSQRECENCKISKEEAQLFIFYPKDIEMEIKNGVSKFRRNELDLAMKFDFGRSDEVILVNRYKKIRNLIRSIETAPKKALCGPCMSLAIKESLWNKINDPLTSNKDFIKALKEIIKRQSKSEIEKLLQIMGDILTIKNANESIDTQIDNPGEKTTLRLWSSIHSVSRFLSERFQADYPDFLTEFLKKCINFIDSWSETANIHNTNLEKSIQSKLVKDILLMLYRFEKTNGMVNQYLFRALFRIPINLYQFIYNAASFIEKPVFMQFLIENTESENLPQDKIETCLHALIYCKNGLNSFKLAERLPEFPYKYQELLLKDFFNRGHSKVLTQITNIMNEFQKEAEEREGEQSEAESPFTSVSFNEKKKILALYNDLNQKNTESHKKIAEERAKLEPLYRAENKMSEELFRVWRKKRGPSPNMMKTISRRLVQKYRRQIQPHIDKYRNEIGQYFRDNPEINSLLAFDVEEYQTHVLCIMSIEIYSDLKFRVKILAVNDIYPVRKYSSGLFNEFYHWLSDLTPNYVLSHGDNENERMIVQKSGHIQINTQEILREVRELSYENSRALGGEGLRDFEEIIDFKRITCEFFKHDLKINTIMNNTLLSIDNHLNEKPQRICKVCNKEQDVLFYCLEDAFSSLLIYVYYANRFPTLKSLHGKA